MKIGIPKEIVTGERRVALIPELVSKLVASGFQVLVETGAGKGSFFADELYKEAGASIVPDAKTLFGEADVILKVQKLVKTSSGKHEVELMSEGSAVIAFLSPLADLDLVRLLADRKITSFSMEMVPRITRAQKMDALSSMATIAGYKAVLLGASYLGKLFPMLTTAAGTIPPAKVFILGAGVAGLQAIATARRLGAVVEAFDTRPAVKEQVKSLGAAFVELDLKAGDGEMEDAGGYAKQLSDDVYKQEQALVLKHVKEAELVITTAQIPGKPAPRLITEDMVRVMKPGSVIVDLASESGGNCALTKAGEVVEWNGVTILGPVNLVSTVSIHGSQMYSKNIYALFTHLVKEKNLNLDWNDEITKGACITHGGKIVNQAVQSLFEVSNERRTTF